MNKNRKAETRWNGIGFTSEIIGSNGNSDYSTPELEPVQQIIERIPLGASSAAVIDCFDCKQNSELDGYRFTLVPLCKFCRTERERQITRNRFGRRRRGNR